MYLQMSFAVCSNADRPFFKKKKHWMHLSKNPRLINLKIVQERFLLCCLVLARFKFIDIYEGC